MRIARHLFVPGAFILCSLFLCHEKTYAQSIAPSSYLFVEVSDGSGQAVEGATVKVSGADGREVLKAETNKTGVMEKHISQRSDHHYEIQISKPGYQTYEQVFFPKYSYTVTNAIVAGMPTLEDFKDSRSPPIKIRLLTAAIPPNERQPTEAEERRRKFLLAARRGDAASLGSLLQTGVKADTADTEGVPAIAWAAFAGDPAAIKLLLAAGANLRDKNTLGHQALLIYVAEGISRGRFTPTTRSDGKPLSEKDWIEIQEEIVRRLIEAGAGLNVLDSYRGTVLPRAISQTPQALTTETIKALIAEGANVNAPDATGLTPLMAAAGRDSQQLVPLLLAAGAKTSINAKDKGARSALLYAAASWGNRDLRLERIKTLIAAGAKINEADEVGQTPLMLAAKTGDLDAVQTLLHAGAIASSDVKTKEGQTTLIYALTGYGGVQAGDSTGAIIKALIAAGASVNDVDSHGRSALLYACGAQWYHGPIPEAVTHLITGGANVNVVDEDGQTALILAAQAESLVTAEALLKAGATASIDVKDKKNGRTALLHALFRTYVSVSPVALALISAGANVNVVDESGQTPLMFAVQQGSEQTIKLLLKAGASLNAEDLLGRTALDHARTQDAAGLEIAKGLMAAGASAAAPNESGQTPLMSASAREYNIKMVQTLLGTEARATINAKDKRGLTALINAAAYGDADVVRALLAAGANINDVDREGRTALMYTMERSSDSGVEIMRILIAAGANLRATDITGRTAMLHLSQYSRSVSDRFKVLIAAGANVNTPDYNGQTPLMMVSGWYTEPQVRTLLDAGASINAKDKDGKTALLYAVSQNYATPAAVTKTLIAAGANVNEATANGQTPLMLAAKQRDSLETIQALLKHGAAIDPKDKQGQNALMYAVSGNRDSTPDSISAAVKALIAAKAEVNNFDVTGLTPLMLAAKTRDLTAIQLLLNAGAKATINAKDKTGQTALLYATADYYGSAPEIVKALVAAGADVNVADGRSQTPLILASFGHYDSSPETVKTLIAAGANVNAVDASKRTALMLASSVKGYKRVIDTLLASGAKTFINAKDDEGRTALMYAAYGNREANIDILEALIAAGADLKVVDKRGVTPLMSAAETDILAGLTILLKHGARASIDAKDKDGQTALMYAVRGAEQMKFEKVKLLLAAGADPKIQNNKGRTALIFARESGNEAVVKLLEERAKP
jgi:ankyrin repeat protein